jgi:cation:H+ antiporter
MMAGWGLWLQFLVCLGIIGYGGTQLSKYGDVLAEKTGLGRSWLGLAGLGVVTSLPEFFSGASALWLKVPDITVGNLLGAVVLNLLLLAIADLAYPPGPVLSAAARGHILAAGFALILLAVAAWGLMTPAGLGGLSWGHVGFSTPVLLGGYLLGMHATFRYHRREWKEYLTEAVEEEPELYPHLTLKDAAVKFALHALVVIAVALYLPRLAEDLAHLMGWSLSLVGTLFVALVTTTPEAVVTLGALRLGAVDLAVGNLLGSVLVNVAMLGLLDLLYLDGPLLRHVSPQHTGTALLAILMTSIAVTEMAYRPQKKALRYLSLGAFVLTFLYAVYIYSMLHYGSG